MSCAFPHISLNLTSVPMFLRDWASPGCFPGFFFPFPTSSSSLNYMEVPRFTALRDRCSFHRPCTQPRRPLKHHCPLASLTETAKIHHHRVQPSGRGFGEGFLADHLTTAPSLQEFAPTLDYFFFLEGCITRPTTKNLGKREPYKLKHFF